MIIEISDIDILHHDKSRKNHFVVFSREHIDLDRKVVFEASVILASSDHPVSCEIYIPAPNNEIDPPHLHLRSEDALGLREKLKIGDLIVVEK